MADNIDIGFREPTSCQTDGRKTSRVLHGPNEYLHNYFSTLREIDDCLEKWLQFPLLFAEQENVAGLIHNLFGPIFTLETKQVDSARLRNTLEGLDAAIAHLQQAKRSLENLPPPVNDRVIP